MIISYVKNPYIIKYGMHKSYSFIFVKCIKEVRTKVDKITNYITIAVDVNLILLLVNINTRMFNFSIF